MNIYKVCLEGRDNLATYHQTEEGATAQKVKLQAALDLLGIEAPIKLETVELN